MGRQSSRLIYKNKDHKDILFQGKYHNAMYLGSQLLWKKIQKIIPYISYDDYYREMCINTLDVDSKTIKKVARLIGTEFNDNKLARGDNTVGYMIGDTSWAFSKDGQNFTQTERLGTSSYGELSAYAGYALTKNCIISSVRESTVADIYAVVSRDIDSFKISGGGGLGKLYGRIYSGFVNPELDILIHRDFAEGSDHPYWNYYVEDAKTLRRLYGSGYTFVDNYKNLLGSDDRYIYFFCYIYHYSDGHRNQVRRYDYVAGNGDILYSTIERNFYMNIIGSFYENGKFIVYRIDRRNSQTSVEGRLQIYETTDFLNFSEIETPQSITVKDISSDGEYTISFDSDVDGDVYIQPYCNLDNTYYFDESGVMHDDEGCLFHTNLHAKINETRYKKIVTIYFDNHYFRESDNNFCQILLFEEQDIEPPLG